MPSKVYMYMYFIPACFANGTIILMNDNPGVYKSAQAMHGALTAAALQCSVDISENPKIRISGCPAVTMIVFLAHLSRGLKGELIGKVGIRRPSVVRPSSSTISNDISSEAVWPKLLIFGIKYPQEGGTKNVFCSDRIRTLVAMPTYTSHRLIMEKKWKLQIFAFSLEIFEFYFQRNVY